MIALSAVESSVPTFIHIAILFIYTSDSAWYNQVLWLIETPYLSIIPSDDLWPLKVDYKMCRFLCSEKKKQPRIKHEGLDSKNKLRMTPHTPVFSCLGH